MERPEELSRVCQVTHRQLITGRCPWCEFEIVYGRIDTPSEVSERHTGCWDLDRMMADLDGSDLQVQGMTLANLRECSLSSMTEQAGFKLLLKAASLEPEVAVWPMILGFAYHFITECRSSYRSVESQNSGAKALEAFERAAALESDPQTLSLILKMIASQAFAAEEFEKARRVSEEILSRSATADLRGDGDAIHQAHRVLGELALNAGDVELACKHLLASAESQGGTVLSSFGPNMRLARALVIQGREDSVLQYLDKCTNFWEFGSEKLLNWQAQIRRGKVPDFGGNLHY